MFVFNLKDYGNPGRRVYVKEHALYALRTTRINAMSKFCRARVIIPPDTFSVNPSFFYVFFKTIVESFGYEWFKDNVAIDNQSKCEVDDNLELALERIIRHQKLGIHQGLGYDRYYATEH